MIADSDGAIYGVSDMKVFHIPDLNFDTEHYSDMIDWSNDIHDPFVTAEMNIENIKKIKFENHTQSVEWMLSSSVIGKRRREGHMKVSIESQKIYSSSDSEKICYPFIDPIEFSGDDAWNMYSLLYY